MLLNINYCTINHSHTPYVLKVYPLKLVSHHFFIYSQKILKKVEICRYLGITILTKNSDLDLKSQNNKGKCSVGVNCNLFKAYCSNL